MNKRAAIHQFGHEKKHAENELEDLLSKIDDPACEFPGLLFADLDNMAPLDFQEDDDDYIIFLDDNILLIDGSEDVIDFIASRKKIELSALLANGDETNPDTFAKNEKIPLVRDVEALLSGDIGISRKSDLPKLGIEVSTNCLILDARWEMLAAKPQKTSYATETWICREKGITLETTLNVRRGQMEIKKCQFTSHTDRSDKQC